MSARCGSHPATLSADIFEADCRLRGRTAGVSRQEEKKGAGQGPALFLNRTRVAFTSVDDDPGRDARVVLRSPRRRAAATTALLEPRHQVLGLATDGEMAGHLDVDSTPSGHGKRVVRVRDRARRSRRCTHRGDVGGYVAIMSPSKKDLGERSYCPSPVTDARPEEVTDGSAAHGEARASLF